MCARLTGCRRAAAAHRAAGRASPHAWHVPAAGCGRGLAQHRGLARSGAAQSCPRPHSRPVLCCMGPHAPLCFFLSLSPGLLVAFLWSLGSPKGELRESNPRPLAPKARIMPLDQTPKPNCQEVEVQPTYTTNTGKCGSCASAQSQGTHSQEPSNTTQTHKQQEDGEGAHAKQAQERERNSNHKHTRKISQGKGGDTTRAEHTGMQELTAHSRCPQTSARKPRTHAALAGCIVGGGRTARTTWTRPERGPGALHA